MLSLSSSDPVNTIRHKNSISIKHHFSQFVSKIRKHLTENSVDAASFRDFLKVCYKELPDLNLEDVDGVFEYFISNGYWDHNSHHFLSEAIETLSDPTFKEEEKKYQDHISGYFATEKISSFIFQEKDKLARFQANRNRKWSTARKRSGREYRDQLAVKWEVMNVETKTLKYVEDLWGKLSYLGLPKIGVVLDCIVYGSVWIVWIIIIPSISEEVRQIARQTKTVKFFEDNKIVQVFLNNECLYIAAGEDKNDFTKKVLKQASADSIEEEPEEHDACFNDNMESAFVRNEQPESDNMESEIVSNEQPESDTVKSKELCPVSSELAEDEELSKQVQEAEGKHLQPVSSDMPNKEGKKAMSEQAGMVSHLSYCAN